MGEGVILYRSPVPALQVLVAVVRLLVEDRMGGPPWSGFHGGHTHYRSWCSVSIEMLLFFEEVDCSSLCQFAKLSLTSSPSRCVLVPGDPHLKRCTDWCGLCAWRAPCERDARLQMIAVIVILGKMDL